MPSPQPYRHRRGFDVQALQWQPDNPEAFAAAVEWLRALHYNARVWDEFLTDAKVIGWTGRLGYHEVSPGGWIVQVTADGSVYALDADRFAAEFVPASVESEVAR